MRLFLSLATLLVTTIAAAQASPVTPTENPFLRDLNLSAAVDLIHPIYFSDELARENLLRIRSAEVNIYGPLDPVFDGLLNLAAHDEAGRTEFSIHEAYVGSTKLIPYSRFRAGKFNLSVGRLNQSHQHDWPFISAPLVFREFFSHGPEIEDPNAPAEVEDPMGAENARDTGFEYSVLLPTPFFFDLTVGVTNGYCFGHCHDRGMRPNVPTHYVRPTFFFELGEASGLLTGLNYLSRTDNADNKMTLVGADATYKSREGKILQWLVQGELWYRTIDFSAQPNQSAIGGYLYPQYALTEAWYFGPRLDVYSVVNPRNDAGAAVETSWDLAVVPTLTYQASEFTKFRLAYTHEMNAAHDHGHDHGAGGESAGDRRLELQFVYLMGAHPAHDF